MSLIIGTLIDRNGILYTGDKQVSINCAQITTPPVQAWITPNPSFTGYNFPTFTEPSPATAFDIKVVQVSVGTDTYRLSGDVDQFISLCNQCCDAESYTLTPIAYTPLTTQSAPVYVDNGDCTCSSFYYFRLPEDSETPKAYTVKFYCNGVLIGTSSSFTTVAAALAYAQANWGAYGTWTLTDSVLTLENAATPVCTHASVTVTFTTRDYCLDIHLLNGLTFDTYVTDGYSAATGTIAISATGAAALVVALQPFVSDGTLTAYSANRIHYSGTGLPQSLKLGAATIASFSAGTCAS